MDTIIQIDTSITLWLNSWVGHFPLVDMVCSYIVSDYLVPLVLSLIVLGLWFSSPDRDIRFIRQQAVFVALLGVAFGNLTTLILNNYITRSRPFVDHPINLLFYSPTDSSFPSNPAVVAFALANGIWLANPRVGIVAYFLASAWSISRIYAGVSYSSDIIIGAGVGISISVIIAALLGRMRPVVRILINMARYLFIA